MEFVVDKFQGGMINDTAPELLTPPYAQDMLGADITRGDIRPVDTPDQVGYGSDLATYLGNGERSVVEFDETFYWTDNVTGGMLSSGGAVGLPAFSALPGLSPEHIGDVFIGKYRYKFLYASSDGRTGALAPGSPAIAEVLCTRDQAELVDVNTAGIPRFNPTHYADINNKSSGYRYALGALVKYENTDGELRVWRAKVGVYSYGSDTILPGATPGQDNGRTWEDVTAHSATTSGYMNIRVYDIAQPAGALGADYVNIYRTVSEGTNYYLVGRIPVGQVEYVDSISDAELITREPYPTGGLSLPPVYLYRNGAWAQSNTGKYLTESNGVFYQALGNRVYVSKQDSPQAWDPNNWLEFEDEITALAREDRGVLVFSRNRTWHVVGTTIADITRRWVPEYQGCPNWRTIGYVNNTPHWVSLEGICRFGYIPNVSVEKLEVISKGRYRVAEWVAERPNATTFATVIEQVYVLFSAEGGKTKVLACDLARDRAFTSGLLPIEVTKAVYDAPQGRVVLGVGEGPTTWYAYRGPYNSTGWIYVSPRFDMGSSKKKRIRALRITADGPVQGLVRMFRAGQVLDSPFSSPGSGYRRKWLPFGLTGDRVEVALTGRNRLSKYSVEFQEVGKDGLV